MGKNRDKFNSKLGFILTSAGCAIGLGNVWRFPYIAGKYGGGIFLMFYLLAVSVFAYPIVKMELAIGRACKRSPVGAFEALSGNKRVWRFLKWPTVIADYVFMMLYCTVTGWMMWYMFQSVKGYKGFTSSQSAWLFRQTVESPAVQIICTLIVVLAGFLIISMGVNKGLEKTSKIMVSALIILLVTLTVLSMFREGAIAGIKRFLLPDPTAVSRYGLFRIFKEAVTQAFFSIGLGGGALIVLGGYSSEKTDSISASAVKIIFLDTLVAVFAGLFIFISCGISGHYVGSGPGLVLEVLPVAFSSIYGGALIGTVFFAMLFMACFTTVVTAFESQMRVISELFGVKRKKACFISCVIMIAATLPAALGYNLLSSFHPLGAGTTISDLEDLILSNIILPVSCAIIVIFCTIKAGWGWNNYMNTVCGEKYTSRNLLKEYYNRAGLLVILSLVWVSLILGF